MRDEKTNETTPEEIALRRKTYEVVWRNMIWTAAGPKDLDTSTILTVLKGFGPMEILRFEKPEEFWGELSVYLDDEEGKCIVVYHLEVMGPKRSGVGRKALQYLQEIFCAGQVHVEDPGGSILVRGATHESASFWIAMFEEGLIRSLESDILKLSEETTEEELREFCTRFGGD